MKNDFQSRKANVDAHLDQSGIGHDFKTPLIGELQVGAAVAAKLSSRIVNQALYDYTVNVPTGILSREECRGHAVRHGLVATVAEHLEWEPMDALRFCHDLLEDVNFVSEAARLEARIKELEEAQPDPV